MPIRDESSFDPTLVPSVTGNLDDLNDVSTSGVFNGAIIVYSSGVTGWIIGSGLTSSSSINDFSDVATTGAQSGQVLGYQGSVLGWIPVNQSGGTIPSTLNDLTDVSTTGFIQSNMWLGYNGANWVQSYFYFANLADASGNGLIDQDHTYVYQSNVGKYVNTHILVAPTGLTTSTGNNNTHTLIAASVNSRGYAYIPSGIYYITQQINVTKPGGKIFGPGTIRAANGFTQTAMINLAASGCSVEDIIIDGSGTNGSSTSIGINMAGDDCAIIGVTITGVNNYHSVNAPGNRSLIDRCRIYGPSGIGSCIDAAGPIITIQNSYLQNWGRKGIICDHQRTGLNYESYVLIDNCFITNSGLTDARVGINSILVDCGSGSQNYNSVSIKNSIIEFRIIPTGEGVAGSLNSAMVKVATADTVIVDNCQISCKVTGENLVYGLGVAERVGKLKIIDSTISPSVEYLVTSDYATTVSDTITIENSRIGNFFLPFHSGYIALNDLEARNIFIKNSHLITSGINTAIDLSTGIINSRLEVTDCLISGYRDGGTFSALNYPSGNGPFGTNRIYWHNNKLEYGGNNSLFSATSPTIRFLQSADLNGVLYGNITSASQSHVTGLVGMNTIMFQKGDIVVNTGTLSTGSVYSWLAVASGIGTGNIWSPKEIFGSDFNINQSYFTGVNDTVLSGIPSTGADVTTQFKNFFNNIQNNTVVRISPGIYRLTDTVTAYGKNNITFDCRGATFIEVNRLPSGTFWFDRCTGISWDGGYITGADTLSYLLATASGIERSGIGFEDLGPAGDTGESARKVLGQTFNLNFCKDITITNVRTVGKYRNFVDYFGENIKLSNLYHQGVQTGFSINSADERPLLGTGTVTFGEYYKEGSRNSASYSFGKTSHVIISNCITENIGNMIVAGTPSLGGGGSVTTNNLIITHCIAHNVYDNGIYLSSMHKADVTDFRVINDPGIPHASIVGMKGRGSYIRFNNCHVQNTHGGYGIEGFGGSADYWTNGGSVGWTSEGCAIIGCTASGTVGPAVFLDRNNSIYPRDVLIQGNYFFQCGLGPSGRIPTGYLSTQIGDISAIILANDGYRTKIIDNTIENSGSLCADNGIFVGNKFLGTSVFITGAEIRGNRLLGQKVGIYLKNADYARVRDNYGERIGANNYGFTTESGTPALIQTYNVRNSFFTDNILAPSGHAFVLRTKPTGLWENNIVRDNIGTEQIN